jgi:hypothetical protein
MPMSLVDQIKEASESLASRRGEDTQLQQLLEFYREMQRVGVVVKRAYDIPPIYTVGRTAFRTP